MTADRKDIDSPAHVMEVLAHDMVEGTDRAAQLVLAELSAFPAGMARQRLTNEDRRRMEAEIEAGFDNMPV